MTREEAIKIIKEFINGTCLHLVDQEALETLIPELNESEDEKIRRILLKMAKVPRKEIYEHEGITKEQAITYLEKQKELDKMIVVSPEVWDNAISDAYENGKKDGEKQKEPHYTKRNALFDKCVENCDPKTVEEVNKRVDDIINMPELSAFEQALTNFIGYWEDDEEHWPSQFVKKHGKHILDMAREELQKEQKPANNNKSEMSDENGHLTGKILVEYGAHAKVRDGKRHCEMEWKEFQRLAHYFYELGKAEQKPAEWSEEDENRRDGIIQWLREYQKEFNPKYDSISIESIESLIDWLKSLRPQPKDETYKEKDEAFKLGKHQLAIAFMNYLDENRPDGKMGLSNGECEDIDMAFKENDWAEIMRYYEKYRPSWKPSEEDIKMLEHIIGQYETGNKNSKVMGYLPRVEELNFLKKVLARWKNLL